MRWTRIEHDDRRRVLVRGRRYQVAAEPIVTRVCWCRLCQFIGAGSGTVNTCFPSSAVSVSGQLKGLQSVADSGEIMHRRFCPCCGTHIISEAESRPHILFIRVGTLDNPEIAVPDRTIWVSQAPGWACVDPSIPARPGQPPPAA